MKKAELIKTKSKLFNMQPEPTKFNSDMTK